MCKRPQTNIESVKSSASTPAGEEVSTLKSKGIAPTHLKERNTSYDWLIFLGPALFWKITPVVPLYLTAITRMIVTQIILSLHYMFVDKENYLNKISAKQLKREKDDYFSAYYLHMYAQIPLQLMFPSMFFSDNSGIKQCMLETFLAHVFVVEPLYYFVHKWLHVPSQMKAMHGFHHLSINTLPPTSLVQNFHEHFVYVATFGPAFMLPYLLGGRNHWVAIAAYLTGFDIVNAYGHTNIRVRHWLFTSKWSPLTYLLYTPEVHLGHHAYFSANYTLFMPLWDRIFGTYREYKKKDVQMLPDNQQDFVFIGHNGGLGHYLTIPELNFYNIYEKYSFFLPMSLDVMIMHWIGAFTRLFTSFYYCPRFCIQNEYIGRIICLARTPIDYIKENRYDAVNKDIIKLMKKEHKTKGTRYFGLGNLNKMKQLNDGGVEIAKMVAEDEYLKDKNIRVWTGDTLTVASVYHIIADMPNVNSFYYIGAGGKVGTAVCEMLVKNNPNMKIRIFSRNQILKHPNISYSTDLSEMADYEVVLVGKILSNKMYKNALKDIPTEQVRTKALYDYTVPVMPVHAIQSHPAGIKQIRVGLLKTQPSGVFLKGYYDMCMSHPQYHIVPCHFGCLLNTTLQRETNEVGEICQGEVEKMWKMALARGFSNAQIEVTD